MQQLNPVVVSIRMQIINFRNMFFQNFLRAKNTWWNKNIKFYLSQINTFRFCFFDNNMLGMYIFALNVVRLSNNLSLQSNERGNFPNRRFTMVGQKIQTSDNWIFNFGIIALCQYLFCKKTRAGAAYVFLKENHFNIWKFIVNQTSTIFSIFHRLFRENVVSRFDNFQIFFVMRWFIEDQDKINKFKRRDNFSTTFLANDRAIKPFSNPNCFVRLDDYDERSTDFATSSQIAEVANMKQIKNTTDERCRMWPERLPEFREGSNFHSLFQKFSSPKIKIWFEPMFFSGFFCGFERYGSAAFSEFRGGTSSPPQAAKCVRTNSRILHQTGKVKEF